MSIAKIIQGTFTLRAFLDMCDTASTRINFVIMIRTPHRPILLEHSMQRENTKLAFTRGRSGIDTGILGRICGVLYVEVTSKKDMMPRVALPNTVELRLDLTEHCDDVRAVLVCCATVRNVHVVMYVKAQDDETRPDDLVREVAGQAPRKHTAHRIKRIMTQEHEA
jgi:hypothetical protein